MPVLELSVDEVLTTTRAVRRRLDFDRPVQPEVVRECLAIALQAPTPGGMENWHFVVVADEGKRRALGDIYRRAAAATRQEEMLQEAIDRAPSADEASRLARQAEAVRYFTENIHRAPVHVIPCLQGRIEALPRMVQAAMWGGIWPAAWSFMLAARARGLGTVLTTLHLELEEEAAAVLGIPFAEVMQAGLIATAYTRGVDFRPAKRKPVDSVLHWDGW